MDMGESARLIREMRTLEDAGKYREMTKQTRSTHRRAVCARRYGIPPLSNREVSEEVR